MINDEKKKRIESLSSDEMLYEINLGRKSRFQRESFAYLQSIYDKRMRNNQTNNNYANSNDIHATEAQQTKSNPSAQITNIIHDPTFKISPLRIIEGVIIGVLVVCVLYLNLCSFWPQFKKPITSQSSRSLSSG